MLNDKQAEDATRELLFGIIDKCAEYAEKDNLPVAFVLETTGKALVKISKEYSER